MWQPKPGARAGSPTEQRRRRAGWGWDRSGRRCGYGAASRRGKRARGCRRSTMARCPLAGRRPVPEWTWTRPERRRPGATGQMAQKGRKACRPHGSGDCDGSPAGAETAGQQRGSPVSAGCPRQPGRRACPCGIAGWDAYRRASAAMWTRMRKEVQGRGSEPPQKARAGQPERGRPGPAGARPTPTGRPSSGAGGPYGSSERPVADRPAADGRSHSPADSRPARLRAEAPATAVPANAPASAGGVRRRRRMRGRYSASVYLGELASGFGSTFHLATLASTHGLLGHAGSLQVAGVLGTGVTADGPVVTTLLAAGGTVSCCARLKQ